MLLSGDFIRGLQFKTSLKRKRNNLVGIVEQSINVLRTLLHSVYEFSFLSPHIHVSVNLHSGAPCTSSNYLLKI